MDEPYCRICTMIIRRAEVGPGWVHVIEPTDHHAPSPDDKTLTRDMED